MDLNKIRSSDDYVKTESMAIDVTTHTAPSESEKENHGTIITLKSLKISRLLSEGSFGTSMARRFAINSGGDDFLVKINGNPMPVEDFLQKLSTVFQRIMRQMKDLTLLPISIVWVMGKKLLTVMK